MRVRCPHCHNPMEIVADEPMADIECPSCGSHFELVAGQSTATYRQPPRMIGQFQLLQQVGMGKFGTVWKARDTELDRTVAVKIPRSGDLDAVEAEQFLREARAAAQVTHPNLVSVHEVGREEGTIYIVSDFIEGANLREYASVQRLTFRETAELSAAIASALHAAHEAGVIHRDLKPQNIMMDITGKPHVADFGLAKRQGGEITMTIEGQILGTPAYMPPEQIDRPHDVDHRADIYSLGVILYELLTGELPFRGQRQMLLLQIQRDEPAAPRKLNHRTPRDLETICLKCMEKDPRRRYSTAKEVEEDLHRYLHGVPVIARPVGRLERAWRWCRRYPARAALFSVTATALLTLLGVGTGYVHRSGLQRMNRSLKAVNAALQTSKAELQSSVDRQKGLTEQLENSLSETEAARATEAKAKDALDRILYWRRIALAVSKWEQEDVTATERLLSECPVTLRGWEWKYLHHLCHSERVILRGHAGSVFSTSFSPDGKRIVTSGEDRTLRIWDSATGQELTTFRGHGGRISSVAFRRNGRYVATAASDSTSRVWDVTARENTPPVQGRILYVDGTRIVTEGDDRTIFVTDTATGRQLFALRGHTASVCSVAFSANSDRMATADIQGTLKLWDAANGSEILTLNEVSGSLYGVTFSPDGNHFAAARSDARVKVWDTATGNEALLLKGHFGWVSSFAFSPNGKQIATAGMDRYVRLWDATNAQKLLTLPGPPSVLYHRTISGQRVPLPIKFVAFTPDGSRIAVVNERSGVTVWDATNGQESFTLEGTSPAVVTVIFSRDGNRIVTGCSGGIIEVWDAVSGEGPLKLKGGSGFHVAFSEDGTRVYSAGRQTCKVWDSASTQADSN